MKKTLIRNRCYFPLKCYRLPNVEGCFETHRRLYVTCLELQILCGIKWNINNNKQMFANISRISQQRKLMKKFAEFKCEWFTLNM